MRRARPLLGTFVEIDASGLGERQLERAIDAAFTSIARVHRLMSFHDPDSDLSRLNHYAARGPVAVDPWTIAVLRHAKRLFEATSGLFDCAVGYEMMQREMLPRHDFTHVEEGTLAAVHLLPDSKVIFAARTALDLGGIAKGFAVDRATATLRAHGVRETLVNAGGDIRVTGSIPQAIYIRSGGTPASIAPGGNLQNGAIATSTADATVFRSNAPFTANPNMRNAYSVIAPTCLIADALTKVLVQVNDPSHEVLAQFGAVGLITSADPANRVAV